MKTEELPPKYKPKKVSFQLSILKIGARRQNKYHKKVKIEAMRLIFGKIICY
jgi:hypothetical protein